MKVEREREHFLAKLNVKILNCSVSIIGPTETLHFFNAPPSIDRDDVVKV